MPDSSTFAKHLLLLILLVGTATAQPAKVLSAANVLVLTDKITQTDLVGLELPPKAYLVFLPGGSIKLKRENVVKTKELNLGAITVEQIFTPQVRLRRPDSVYSRGPGGTLGPDILMKTLGDTTLQYRVTKDGQLIPTALFVKSKANSSHWMSDEIRLDLWEDRKQVLDFKKTQLLKTGLDSLQLTPSQIDRLQIQTPSNPGP